jgi:hypothetical protein
MLSWPFRAGLIFRGGSSRLLVNSLLLGVGSALQFVRVLPPCENGRIWSSFEALASELNPTPGTLHCTTMFGTAQC